MTVKLTSNFFSNARGITFKDASGVAWTFNASTNELTAAVASALGGTVTTVSVTTANGVSGSVANPTTTPAISLTLGAITPTSVAATGTVTGSNVSGTTSGTNTGDQVVPAAGNPTAKVGSAAVNGVATTFMRSDASPPVDLTAAFTWTGTHTFNKNVVITSNGPTALAVNGFASAFTIFATASAGANTSLGALIRGGTSASDTAILVQNQAGSASFFFIAGDGSGTLGPSSTSGVSWTAAGAMKFSTSIGINGATPPAQVTGFGTPVGGAVVASYNITDAGGANSNTNKCVAEILSILKAYGMIGA